MDREISLSAIDEPYLAPYRDAAERHGAEFESLLWASPQTQKIRFEALRAAADPAGKFILDAGCGRADYLEYLLEQKVRPAGYVGTEGVEALAMAAESKQFPGAKIIRADFVRHPIRMFVGADIVVFSGSLNTLEDGPFTRRSVARLQRVSRRGSGLQLPGLVEGPVGRDYLHWRRKQHVQSFAEELGGKVRMIEDYLDGDCTVCLEK